MHIDDLIDQLQRDGRRFARPFSKEIAEAHRQLFDGAPLSHQEIVAILSKWLVRRQPCLFGRAAAQMGRLDYCVLTDSDFVRGDAHVRQRIQAARRGWKIRAVSGQSHGFVILAQSPRIAYATPSTTLRELALRLCELYLSKSETDAILHDELTLRVDESADTPNRTWKVGVNVFAAAADGRWWHDHRIPGGLALSMNSIGHMSRKMAEDYLARVGRSDSLGTARERLVSWAVPMAMRTILTAERESAIPGTRLAGRRPDDESMIPDAERDAVLRDLAPYSENQYIGQYHTDITVPSEYFTDSFSRPVAAADHNLFFTYLHSSSDSDYASMGVGLSPEEVLTPEEWLVAGFCDDILRVLGVSGTGEENQ